MRVLCVIPDLGPGGAERAMSRLASSLAERHQVTLMTYEAQSCPSFYPLSEHILVLKIGLLGGDGFERLRRIVARVKVIRNFVTKNKPDVVLSFMDTVNVTVVGACLGTGVPIVVSERTDPSRHYIPKYKSYLRLAAYALANRVIVQTSRVRECFPKFIHCKIDVIPNSAPQPLAKANPQIPSPNGRYRIVGLGRLGAEKGFDRLIAAFGVIANKHTLWDLVIFGEGDQRLALQKQIDDLGLSNRITLPGLTQSPEAELLASHIMAFPSHYEGFPNALAEGVAAGLPAVGFSGVSGIEDLILHEKSGLLISPEDGVNGLSAALDQLMTDPDLRAKFCTAARTHSTKWAPDIINSLWERTLESAIERASSRWRR